MVDGDEEWKCFSILKIIPALQLPRFKRRPSAFSLYGITFLICSKNGH